MDSLDGKTILVTGGSGFAGRHLLKRLLQDHRASIHATYAGLPSLLWNDKAIAWHALDIRDKEAVNDIVSRLRPDIVFHLAAQSHVPTSWSNPDMTWQVNLHGTRYLLEASLRYCPQAVFINVASSDMYGASFQGGNRVTEQDLLMPLNPYAASKAAADLAAYQLSVGSTLKVIRARPFNHSGAGQATAFVLSGFAAQIARIEAGQVPAVIKVGDLSAERDFLHVDDVVTAYITLAGSANTMDSGSAVNIASGRSYVIGDLLTRLLAMSKLPIQVETDPGRARPSDIARVCGSNQRLHERTGWVPQRTMDQLLADVLGYWRQTAAKDRQDQGAMMFDTQKN